MKLLAWVLLAAAITAACYLTWHFLALIRAERASKWVADEITSTRERLDERRSAKQAQLIPDDVE